MSSGLVIALLSMVLAITLSGFGSVKGVGIASQAAVGVLTEDPSKFGRLLVLQLLPGTQGLYGFVVAIMVLVSTGVLGGEVDVSLTHGLAYFMTCLPMALGGFYSAIIQGKVAAAGINLISKRPEESGKAIVAASLVELYAILAFVISLLVVIQIPNIA